MDDNDNNNNISYAWEQTIKRSWETLKEDSEGNIITYNIEKERYKKKKLYSNNNNNEISIRRGLIRYIILVLDCSLSSRDNDFRPTRFSILKNISEKFILEYFDQNPISQLSIAITLERVAEKITDLSGNAKTHLNGIANLNRADGLASLQNILLLSMSILRHVPDYGCREVIILYTSLSTCDSGDIFATMEEVKKLKIRCSVICLSAEIYVCKKLAEMTNGTFSVATDITHLTELMSRHVIPPADMKSTISNYTDFIYMGFPKRQFDNAPTFSFDERDIVTTSASYICPRCHCRLTNIPTACPICSLQLNSSSHIARSYHHLFPVPNYTEVTSLIENIKSENESNNNHNNHNNHDNNNSNNNIDISSNTFSCFGCLTPFSLPSQLNEKSTTTNSSSTLTTSTSLAMKCPNCFNLFCLECDLFIHNTLHNCPGCDTLPPIPISS